MRLRRTRGATTRERAAKRNRYEAATPPDLLENAVTPSHEACRLRSRAPLVNSWNRWDRRLGPSGLREVRCIVHPRLLRIRHLAIWIVPREELCRREIISRRAVYPAFARIWIRSAAQLVKHVHGDRTTWSSCMRSHRVSWRPRTFYCFDDDERGRQLRVRRTMSCA